MKKQSFPLAALNRDAQEIEDGAACDGCSRRCGNTSVFSSGLLPSLRFPHGDGAAVGPRRIRSA